MSHVAGWRPRLGSVGEFWRCRDLLLLLAARDVKVRYQQAVLGVAWVALQPLAGTLVLTIVFGTLLRPGDPLGYAAFVCAGLVPWTFFSGATTRCAASLSSYPGLVTKVYLPRALLPLAAVVSAGLDLAIGILAAGALALHAGQLGQGRLWLLVPALLLCFATSLGAGLWVAALNARFRDVGQILPFALNLGLFVTPVLFDSSRLPQRLAAWVELNPLAWVVKGFRGALLDQAPPGVDSLGAWGIGVGLLLTGVVAFSAGDRTLADVV